MKIEISFEYKERKVKFDAEITEASLLTVDEIESMTEKTRMAAFSGLVERYWTRTPGDYGCVSVVLSSFGIYRSGRPINVKGEVAPYIVVNLKDALEKEDINVSDLIGEEVSVNGYKFVIISEDRLIYRDNLIMRRFDMMSNIYEESELKEYIESDFLKMLEAKKPRW